MAVFKPFKAIRPAGPYASAVAALPYDVMSSEEAAEYVRDKPFSFLHVDKAEVDLPAGTDIYSEQVYLKARDNLNKLISDGILIKDDAPCFYIYRQTMNGRAQTGIVGCCAIDDYINNVIKKHELTRKDKELDRIHHVDTCNANTGPIFLAYRSQPGGGAQSLTDTVSVITGSTSPVYDFVSDDNVGQTVWVVDDPATVEKISALFASIDNLYIADGHHRCASAVNVGLRRREANPGYDGSEEFNYFLSVVFPSEQLMIMPYNRVMTDLNGLEPAEFLSALSENFTVEKLDSGSSFSPVSPHTFGLYLGGEKYMLRAKESIIPSDDVINSLDVSILQNYVISPILNITDPRSDPRIDFVGGIRGEEELVARCKTDMKIAFALYPTQISELLAVADGGLIMPPKSTWFEPKLLSGLFIHSLS